MTHDEMIAVIAAQRDGKEIEFCYLYPLGELKDWRTDPNHRKFNFADYYYRIKPSPPKPRQWKIRVDKYGVLSRSEYEQEGDEIVHVIEVLPSSGESAKSDIRLITGSPP